jgi:Family of unknown function (DUF6232)
MADETSYYADQQGVRVTNKRVIVRDTTYSLANITSVSTTVEQPNLTGPILFILVGCLCFIAVASGNAGILPVLGVFLIVIGVIWYRGCKPTWHLRISSASGEATPLQSVDKQWIGSIAQAINEAMIHRT